MTICKSLGIEVKSHSSTISNTDVQRIRAAFSNYLKAFAQSFPTEPITETETLKDSLISQNGLNCSLLGELLTIKNGKKLIKKPHD
ncbi:hypothetical protein [Nostoc punctiforme]|nr:hypothetical protein [Nostoc punctiforme]